MLLGLIVAGGVFAMLDVVVEALSEPEPPQAAASDESAAANPPPPPAPASAPTPEPPPEPTPEPPPNTKTLVEALRRTVPLMEDAQDQMSTGTGLLMLWAMEQPAAFAAGLPLLVETKRALVMKDSAAERGKRLCVRGRISEIAAVRAAAGTVYEGGIVVGYAEVTRFVAIGDTGELVEGSRARFCGVVTGRLSYSNAGGGTTHAPMLVGAFDLTAD